jgi:hypothetical protein
VNPSGATSPATNQNGVCREVDHHHESETRRRGESDPRLRGESDRATSPAANPNGVCRDVDHHHECDPRLRGESDPRQRACAVNPTGATSSAPARLRGEPEPRLRGESEPRLRGESGRCHVTATIRTASTGTSVMSSGGGFRPPLRRVRSAPPRHRATAPPRHRASAVNVFGWPVHTTFHA